MNQVAEQQTEFEEETVAEAIESAKAETEQEDDGFEIEVVDDTPEEDKGKPRRAEDAEPQVPSDDEVEKYSEGVQKRIKQLKFEFHEERRRKEEAARLQDEALRYAEQMQEENEQLRKTLEEGEGVLVNQAKGRVTAEIDKAKIAYKTAYESGDPDALIEAQAKLSELQVEKSRYDNYKPKPRPEPEPEPEEEVQPERHNGFGEEEEEEPEEEIASEDIPPPETPEPMTKDEIFEDAKANHDVELDRRMKLSELKEQWKKLEEGQEMAEDAPKMRVPKTVRNIFTGNVLAYNEHFKGNPDLEIIEWEDGDGDN